LQEDTSSRTGNDVPFYETSGTMDLCRLFNSL
jgi:hypothetical protein